MTNGTNNPGPGLNAELTEDQIFAQIQTAIQSGSDDDLNKVMENELVEEIKPEAQAVVEAVAPEEVKPVVSATPAPAPEEWFAALPADVQEKVKALKDEKDKLEHKIRSDEGRVPSLQRQVEELKRKVTTQRPDPLAAQVPPAASKSNSKLDEKIAAIREVDPILADTLLSLKEELATPIREEVISRTEEIRSDLRQRDDEELWNRENAKLLAAVPQAHEVFKHPTYKQWKEQQTEGMLSLATSIYAEDVLIAFEKFTKDMQRLNPPQAVAEPVKADVPAAVAPAVVDPKAATIANERERKLRSSAPSAVSGVAKPGGDGLPEDEESLFKFYTDKIRKQEM